jgi:hypothetical protein
MASQSAVGDTVEWRMQKNHLHSDESNCASGWHHIVWEDASSYFHVVRTITVQLTTLFFTLWAGVTGKAYQ